MHQLQDVQRLHGGWLIGHLLRPKVARPGLQPVEKDVDQRLVIILIAFQSWEKREKIIPPIIKPSFWDH